ncbi:hypothetical protein Tco_0364745 [Tanacetum coccineum]
MSNVFTHFIINKPIQLHHVLLQSTHPQQIVKCILISFLHAQLVVRKIGHQCLDLEDKIFTVGDTVFYENKEHFQSEKEAIFLLLTGIGDEIYSTVDACNTAYEMWITLLKGYNRVNRLKYKILFNILNQFQLEVNDIRAERIAKSANPLALIAAAQPYSDNYYQAQNLKESNEHHSATRQMHLPDQRQRAQRDMEMHKKLAHSLLSTSRSLYKPTNNNIRTSSNSRNKTEDTSPRCSTQADPSDWLEDTDEEMMTGIGRHFSYMAKIQEVSPEEIQFYLVAIGTGLLALKDIEIKEGLKTKAYEISVLNQKHDELVKKSLLTRSQLEDYLKENTKVISDLKVKEEKDIDKMIKMDKQLKFLNEIVYTRNQSIQTIHMLAPKCATYNGRLTFANPRFAPEKEETMTLDNVSRTRKGSKEYNVEKTVC